MAAIDLGALEDEALAKLPPHHSKRAPLIELDQRSRSRLARRIAWQTMPANVRHLLLQILRQTVTEHALSRTLARIVFLLLDQLQAWRLPSTGRDSTEPTPSDSQALVMTVTSAPNAPSQRPEPAA